MQKESQFTWHIASPFLRWLTVAAVMPGNSRSRPTFRFSSVLTRNFTVVFALHTVSQLTTGQTGENRLIKAHPPVCESLMRLATTEIYLPHNMTDPLNPLITCNIHFSISQRRQVRGVESIETSSIHLGYPITPVEFVVEIQAHLNRKRERYTSLCFIHCTQFYYRGQKSF